MFTHEDTSARVCTDCTFGIIFNLSRAGRTEKWCNRQNQKGSGNSKEFGSTTKDINQRHSALWLIHRLS